MNKYVRIVLAFVALCSCQIWTWAANAADAVRLDAPVQDLVKTLNYIARETKSLLVFPYDDVKDYESRPLKGYYTITEALDEVLKNTGLQAQLTEDGVITISVDPSQLEEEETSVRYKSKTLLMSTATSLALSTQGSAQSADDQVLFEEIVVTARKKDESVQDIPGVINVLTRDQIRANGTTDAESLALNNLGVVYSVTFSGAANPRITIRGVGDDDFNPNGSSSAAVHVNGVYQGTNGLLNNQFFDIAQVEILKGPQGTLYGRNATAGAINIVSTRPGSEYGGYLDVEVGNFGLVRTEGAFDLPMSEAFKVRVAGLYERSDGFFEHLGTGPVGGFSYAPGTIPPQSNVDPQGSWGGADRAFGRLTAEYEVSPATLITLRATIGLDQSELPLSDVTPEIWSEYSQGGFLFLNPNDPALAAFGNALDDDPFTVFSNVLPQQDADQFGANFEIAQEFSEALSGTLVVGYESLDREYATGDNLPLQAADYLWNNEFSQFTVEARLSDDSSDGFGWLLGFFYLDDEVDFGTTLQFRNTGLWQTDIQTDSIQKRSSFGVFASTDWTPVEWFTLETGLRYSADDVSYVGQTVNLDPFGTFGQPPSFFPLGSIFIGNPIDPASPLRFDESLDDDAVTWKVSGIFRPSETLSVYATASTGYKAGGFDGSTILSPQEALPIDPETVTAFEIGAKYQSADGVFNAEVNVFHYDFSDYQSTALLNVNGFDTNVRANVADAKIKGAEVSASLRPIEGLQLNAGLALLDSEIENFQGVQANIEGNSLPFSPDFSWNASAVYSTPISDRFSLNMQIDFSRTGSNFQTINNNDQVDSYVIGNARIGFANEDWELAFWVRNLTDEIYDIGFFPGGALTPDNRFKGAPRTYGVNLKSFF